MEDKDFKKWLSERADGFTLQPSDGAFDRIMEGLEEKKKRGFAWWFMLLPVLFLGVSAMFYIRFAPSTSAESTNAASLLPLNRTGISHSAQNNRVSASSSETAQTSAVSGPHAISSTGQQVSYANRVNSTGSASASSRTASSSSNPAQPGTTGSASQDPALATGHPSTWSLPAMPLELRYPRYESGSVTRIASGFSWKEPFLKETYTPVAKMKRRSKPTYTTGGKFAISAYAEPFMSRSTFRTNDTSLAFSGNYAENRRQQETWSFGFAAGVQGEFRLMKNLYLSAGLGYQYMQNRETTNVPMQYFQTVESLNFDTLTFTTPYGNDTTVIFSFTSTYSSLVQDTLRPVYTNSFQYMEIPIQLGYQFRLSSVVGLRMNVGVSPGILLYSRNLQYDPANSGLIQAQGTESQAARFMLNATAGLEFNFRVANQVSLFAGPSARIGVTSLFDRNAVIRQTPFTIGLKTGFRYQF